MADTVKVRKARAGSDSYGNVWAEDGAVIDVPLAQALDLVSIQDAGCSIVDGDLATEPHPEPEPGVAGVPAVDTSVTGPDELPTGSVEPAQDVTESDDSADEPVETDAKDDAPATEAPAKPATSRSGSRRRS